MAILQIVSEEQIADEKAHDYFGRLYRVVCVAEKPDSTASSRDVVRTTYVVDWEQLVHLLEGYEGFGEDIVEVKAISREEGRSMRRAFDGPLGLARA